MKSKKLVAAAIAVSLFTSAIAVSFAQENGYTPKPVYNSTGEIIGTTRNNITDDGALPPGDILDTKEADVTGDGTVDTVYLTGTRAMSTSPYINNIRIVVKNGFTNLIETGGVESFAGYAPQLFLGDFNGDKIADVYVEAASGGSGGWYHHQIVTFTGILPSIIFDDENNRGTAITGKFINDYKIELTASGKTVILDVSDRRADYLRLGLYNESGLLMKETKVMVTPYGKLAAIDIDNDGIYELQGMQRISGAYNADGLANLESVLKYNDTICWQPLSVKLNITLINAGSLNRK